MARPAFEIVQDLLLPNSGTEELVHKHRELVASLDDAFVYGKPSPIDAAAISLVLMYFSVVDAVAMTMSTQNYGTDDGIYEDGYIEALCDLSNQTLDAADWILIETATIAAWRSNLISRMMSDPENKMQSRDKIHYTDMTMDERAGFHSAVVAAATIMYEAVTTELAK